MELDFFDEENELSKEAEKNKKSNLEKALSEFNINTVSTEEDPNPLENIDEIQDKEVYLSRDGFVETPILRGWFEILPLINIIKDNKLDSFIIFGSLTILDFLP